MAWPTERSSAFSKACISASGAGVVLRVRVLAPAGIELLLEFEQEFVAKLVKFCFGVHQSQHHFTARPVQEINHPGAAARLYERTRVRNARATRAKNWE